MIYTWKNTYNESMGDFFAHVLTPKQKDIFYMLWGSYRLTYITKSCFFQYIRVGDDKHQLWVHKGQNEIITVKFIT